MRYLFHYAKLVRACFKHPLTVVRKTSRHQQSQRQIASGRDETGGLRNEAGANRAVFDGSTNGAGHQCDRVAVIAAPALRLCLEGQSTSVQNRFGVAIGLQGAFKDQFARGLKGVASGQIRSHWLVAGVRLVLCVDHRRHSGEGLSDLLLAHNPMMQPVGNMLTGNPQRGPIFH